MVLRGCLLFYVLVSLLAQVAVAATRKESDDRMLEEITKGGMEDPDSILEDNNALPNPLPPSLLLQLLRSEAALRQQQQQQQQQQPPQNMDSDEDDSSSNIINNDGNRDDNNDIVKRVFCNGFTGCGGRHRELSRRRRIFGKRLIPVLVKRPFCNNFGCFNSKRNPLAAPSVEGFRARLLSQGFAPAAEGETPGGKQGGVYKGKRLFCNGYGGCRGGKRSLFSPWMSKMSSVADSLR
uniref:CCAP-1 n=1 Tax=Charonia tritonis TaxID=1960912 RepID=A0A1S6JQ15_9CAEN|nr:CCAP-1 precursor [Charonia tritonis]